MFFLNPVSAFCAKHRKGHRIMYIFFDVSKNKYRNFHMSETSCAETIGFSLWRGARFPSMLINPPGIYCTINQGFICAQESLA